MHQSVMPIEVTDGLVRREGGRYIDGTAGNGGHTRAILERAGHGARVMVIDRDQEALGRAQEALGEWRGACVFVHGNFADMAVLAASMGFIDVDGIVLDLGVSSEQIDTAERGFSFMQDGPLDMRMDQTQELTAAALVNTLPEDELSKILWRWGEDRDARAIARAICRERAKAPFQTTHQLADVIAGAKRGLRGRIHPATCSFQALRIAVNRELDALTRGLEDALILVRPGGRVGVISFHSVEDREVKHCFQRHTGRWESLAQGGRLWRVEQPEGRPVNRRPIIASEDERLHNPRARSAKLRFWEKAELENTDHGSQK